MAALQKWGPNMFEVPVPLFADLLKQQLLAPFFVFQVKSHLGLCRTLRGYCVGLQQLGEVLKSVMRLKPSLCHSTAARKVYPLWTYVPATLLLLLLDCFHSCNTQGLQQAGIPLAWLRSCCWVGLSLKSGLLKSPNRAKEWSVGMFLLSAVYPSCLGLDDHKGTYNEHNANINPVRKQCCCHNSSGTQLHTSEMSIICSIVQLCAQCCFGWCWDCDGEIAEGVEGYGFIESFNMLWPAKLFCGSVR